MRSDTPPSSFDGAQGRAPQDDGDLFFANAVVTDSRLREDDIARVETLRERL
jgi:hypothetical protein